MTPLADLLIRRIALTGPITVADYMTECLLHPAHGYYITRPPFGTEGDFVTAPEISQMFGEMLGLWLAQCWLDQGRPARFCLAELGPGRGTLMADIMRAGKAVPGFTDAAQIHLVEASAALRHAQAQALASYQPRWHDHAGSLPELPLFLIANEFFDALPIRQFQRAETGWHECQIGLKDGALAFGLSAPAPLADLADRLDDTQPGDVVERRPGAAPVMHDIAARLAQHGGVALILDYGDKRSIGDTLQAVAAHKPVDPLAAPGQADLTAHVDFGALIAEAKAEQPDIAATDLIPQGIFLERLGITQRAQVLAQKLNGAALQSHIAAHRRLTHPEEMGTLFKAIALHPTTVPAPPGLSI